MAPGVLLVDIGFAQQILGLPDQLSRLLLPKDFTATLPEPFKGQLQLKSSGEENNLARLTESFHLNLDALGFLSFVVGLFIVHAAIGLALEQRRGLLRTLRACGVSARMLIACLAVELGGSGLDRRRGRGRQRLPAGQRVAAGCRRQPARLVRRRSGGAVEPEPAVVVQRDRPEPARRLARRCQQSVAGGALAVAGAGRPAGLASGPCALVAAPGLGGGAGLGDRVAGIGCAATA